MLIRVNEENRFLLGAIFGLAADSPELAAIYEKLANKKTTITNSDTDYPTTKAVKGELDLKANLATPVFTGNITTPKIKPSADSTTAVQITKADGTTPIVDVDTANGNVGIGMTPTVKLEVAGIIKTTDTTNSTSATSGSIQGYGLGLQGDAFIAGRVSAGYNTSASGLFSFAYGYETTATGEFSFAFGFQCVASGYYSSAFGNNSSSSGYYSFASGANSISSGLYTFAFGNGVQSSSYNSFACGRFNIGGGTTGSWVNTDYIFEIGNGSDTNNRSNAFDVLKNGNTRVAGTLGVGSITPTAQFSVSEKAGMNEIGGIMVKMTNKTGAASVKGTVVYASATTDNAFNVSPIDGDMPIGVVFTAGIADGAECWIVVAGIAEILLVDSVATNRSYVAYSSGTTAGRIDTSATVPVAQVHFREIGHTIESKAAGTNVLVKCIIHFN